MTISITNITKSFGNSKALDNISVDFTAGELTALLGPSGCGKTTLLRLVAGLEQADPGCGGRIIFNGQNVLADTAGKRKVGFVFQHYALFRHMTVFDNIAFGLRVRKKSQRPTKAEIKERVYSLLELVQLGNMADRMPSELSGGQRQRVALARALAIEPEVLLLDEPFGALDAKVRTELRRWLRQLHDKLNCTSIFVTHDQEEALEVADRVIVMNKGRIEQIGSPDEIFHQPASEFVMQFLGEVNVFHGRIESDDPQMVHFYDQTGQTDQPNARMLIRPHDLDISTEPDTDKRQIPATITKIQTAGPSVRLDCRDNNGKIVNVRISHDIFNRLQLFIGQNIFLTPKQLQIYRSGQK
ncbi:MAG: sulfate ABC transporter ATP-binding protein [Sedimentisphaerales bacterium]|nr:sulfate ABC transporter ATP-binding protein [Sedimentisphaerales bacterium]MBN2842391.1 sulfate ABC transporter ATP-binding protein [Sedimentisphaerales bacterium]